MKKIERAIRTAIRGKLNEANGDTFWEAVDEVARDTNVLIEMLIDLSDTIRDGAEKMASYNKNVVSSISTIANIPHNRSGDTEEQRRLGIKVMDYLFDIANLINEIHNDIDAERPSQAYIDRYQYKIRKDLRRKLDREYPRG